MSCIKEEPVPELVDDGSIIFLCEDSKPATKTTLNGQQTEWIANSDKVGLYSPQASVTAGGDPGVVNEPLTALSSGARSQFSGSVYWNTGDHEFYSYYPYVAGTHSYTAVPVSLSAEQNQVSDNDCSHIGSLDFLIANPYTTKYPGSSGTPATVSLRYNHLFSIIEFQIIRSSGSGSITKVKLSGKRSLAFNSGTIDISQTTPPTGENYVIDSMSDTSKSVTVTLNSAFNPTKDYSTTPKVYMVILPGAHAGDVKIGIESGGVFKEVVKSNVTFKRGKKYIIQVDADNATVPIIDGMDLEPVEVNGVIWAPVNAGYREDLRTGEYFQWFRKYGFDRDFTIKSAYDLWSVDLDQETALDKYKDVFFTWRGSGYEWMPFYQVEWNRTEKFNPCPVGWRLPTKTEVESLISCGSTCIIAENAGGVDGLIGRWVGPNHNIPGEREKTAVFFPFTGTLSASNGTWPSTFISGNYWLAYYGEPSTSYNGQVLTVINTQSSDPRINLMNKAQGVSVRCVKKTASVEALLHTIKPVDVQEGLVTTGGYIEEEGSLPVTERGVFYGSSKNPASTKVVASTAGDGSFTADINGLEETKTYYVRAYAKNSGGTVYYGDQYKFIKKSPANYNGKEIEINGVTWAPYNAGYSDIYPYGLLYQWHRKYGQTYLGETPSPSFPTSPVALSSISSFTYRNMFIISTNSPYDCCTAQQSSWSMIRAHNPCPEGWRVPTKSELQSLLNSGSSWGAGPDGVPGRWFGENHAGTKDNCVFLPAAGLRTNSSNSDHRDFSGTYWSTDIDVSNPATLYFDSSSIMMSKNFRAYGLSVRCVKE